MALEQHTQTSAQIHPVVLKILEKRGFKTPQEIKDFFSWDLKELPNLTNLIDLDKAAHRIIQAINNNEKIGVYGDYDVDGTTSCALLYHFFQMQNIEIELFQPSRFVEGYGIHPSSINAAMQKDVKVLITVDCGISNVETAAYAQGKLDLIITDHHKDAREILPPAFAVINPNRRDEAADSPLKTLAGVGVAFCLALEIKNQQQRMGLETPSIYPLLQFVAIGTICDLAKLDPLNLKLTRHGLKQLPQTTYPGIVTFFTPEEREASFITSEKISFYVGPLINSKGRLDHPDDALKLLIAKNHKEAFHYYSTLEISNTERKFIQAEVFKSAKEKVVQELKSDNLLASIIFDREWHEGVIGIVASKLVNTFSVPALVFTTGEEKGIIKASCRSAGELNIFECLSRSSEFFIKFGGHHAAAGLSMKEENFEPFKKHFFEQLKHIPEIERTVQSPYDLVINFQEITPQLIEQLEILEPFGMGNEKPIFRMTDIKIHSYQVLKDLHVKWFFHHKSNPNIKLSGISFNYIGKWNSPLPEEVFQHQESEDITIQFTLGINRFNGNKMIQLMVDEVMIGKHC